MFFFCCCQHHPHVCFHFAVGDTIHFFFFHACCCRRHPHMFFCFLLAVPSNLWHDPRLCVCCCPFNRYSRNRQLGSPKKKTTGSCGPGGRPRRYLLQARTHHPAPINCSSLEIPVVQQSARDSDHAYSIISSSVRIVVRVLQYPRQPTPFCEKQRKQQQQSHHDTPLSCCLLLHQWAGNIAQRFFTRYGQPHYAEENMTKFAEAFSKQLAPKLLEQVRAYL